MYNGYTALLPPCWTSNHAQHGLLAQCLQALAMSILYVLIPLALLLLGGAVWAFFWAVGSGQFDDLDTPAMRVVMDDDSKPDEGD